MIVVCSEPKCKSPEQDRLYGTGRRVHNETAKTTSSVGRVVVRCTVCKTEKEVNRG